jgi:hypothetical protein
MLWACLLGCRSEDPLPVSIWSQNCVQLSPAPDGYRLSGLCCAYVILPRLTLRANQSFAVDAQYFAFTGAGYAGLPIQVNGNLSADGRLLTINYTIAGSVTSYRLEPGEATTFCYCGCN